MLEIRKGKLLDLVQKYWCLLVVSVALACGFGYLLHRTVNGVLLADDKFIVDYGEESEMIAILSIPTVGMVAPVFETGVDEGGRLEAPIVRNNVGWFREGEREGLARFLAGHNPGVFNKLLEVNISDTVVFSYSGGVENYEIIAIATEELSELNMAEELLKADLVLMTCVGERKGEDFLDRLIIYAKKVQKRLD